MTMKRFTAIVVAAFLLLFVSAFAGIYLFVNVDRFRPKIESKLSEVLGHRVTVESVRLSPASGLLSLELKNLQIHALDPTEPPTMHAKTALLGLGVEFAMRYLGGIKEAPKTPSISSITLISPQINLIQRHKKPLLERAQDTALVSDEKMQEVYGKGLTGLTIGRIDIRDGILTVVDWHHPDGQTLIFDHLQLHVRDLSPLHPSPISASARLQLAPFKVQGHIGPLPASLDPLEMPLTLNFDAKSSGLRHFSSFSRSLLGAVGASRGTFSTMINGNLKDGLKTTSWLELQKFSLIPLKEERGSGQDQAQGRIVRASGQVLERPPVDLVMRQKSTVELKGGVPTLSIEESFIYLDGEPKLDVKGSVVMGSRDMLDLTLNILEPIDIRQIPVSIPLPVERGTLAGHLDISGEWPNSFNLSIHLDLTDTLLTGPAPFRKELGVPLGMRALLIMEDGLFGFEEATLARIKGDFAEKDLATQSEHNYLKITGVIEPEVDLRLVGEWDLAFMNELLPMLPKQEVSNSVQLDLFWSEAQENRVSGALSMEKLKLGRFDLRQLSSEVRLDNQNQLHLFNTKLHLADGRIDMDTTLMLKPEPAYESVFSLHGISLEKLLGKREEEGFLDRLESLTTDITQTQVEEPKVRAHVEGYLFGMGSARGLLDGDFSPVAPRSGSLWAHLEPGRLTRIDPQVIFTPPSAPVKLSAPDKHFDWNRAELFVSFFDKATFFEHVDIVSSGVRLRGHGQRRADGHYRYDLVRTSAWREDEPPRRFTIQGPSWEALEIKPAHEAQALVKD